MPKTYIRVTFTPVDPERSEMLVALLSELGYQGFEEGEESLQAFIGQEAFHEKELRSLVEMIGVEYSLSTEEEKNWNLIWESSFEPVIIPGFVAVRADFHAPVSDVKYEILITPKMSFGTGHHATTFLMMERMRGMELGGRTVLDFGAGTGILAILAEKLGAEQVDAIDNDPQCLLSMDENLPANGCVRTRYWLADSVPNGKYDIVLANINKHILLATADDLKAALSPSGELVLSGLLEQDEGDIRDRYEPIFGEPVYLARKNNWICLAFKGV
jgi:ribosomal protein L11 methyltransferase